MFMLSIITSHRQVCLLHNDDIQKLTLQSLFFCYKQNTFVHLFITRLAVYFYFIRMML